MDYFQAIVLALIQGITEFLPISSSAHLILPFELFGWPDQGLAFDTAVHFGSLLAVMIYFRKDIVELLKGFFLQFAGKPTQDSAFANNLLIASLPVIPVGFFLKDIVETELRGVWVIVATTLIFGVLLLIADKKGKRINHTSALNWWDALLIGISQCFALIPGTSRSGATMTMALFLGYERDAAAKISFLISIPTIAGAALLKTIDLITEPAPILWGHLAIGTGLSFLTAYACIYLFLDWINRIGFMPFVIYRFLLGAMLIGVMVL